MNSMLKKPSAWVPILMSLASFFMLLFYLTKFGIVRNEDEGVAAHLFQLLMGGQLPVIGYFVIKWLPQAPKEGFLVLILQFFTASLSIVPVFYFGF